MPNIAKILKDEITRLARKEVRMGIERTRKAVTQQQREMAKLKGQVKALERQVSMLEREQTKAAATAVEESGAKQGRFGPKGLISTRKRLGLSAAELAKMVGVTAQTIYNWEHGASKPRPEQQAKLISLRGVGKRELQAHMAAKEGETASSA